MRSSLRALLGPLALLQAAAAPTAAAAEQGRVLESPRFEGRGNTFVAGYDSDEATHGNPATMAESPVRFQERWLQLDVLVGENSVSSVNDIAKLNGQASAVTILSAFADKFGKRQYARVQASPLATRIGAFEITPFATTADFVDLRDPTLPEVQFQSDSMYGVALSYAYQWTKALSLGVTLRPAERTLFQGDVSFSDLLQFVDSSQKHLNDLFRQRQGLQIGMNVGAIYQAAPAWRLGLVVENLGYAGNFGGAADPPPPIPQRVDLGGAYRVDWKPWHWDFLVDGQDLTDARRYEVLRLLHLGTELGRSYVSRDHDVGLLAGINEGYLTTGAFLDLFLARLNVSYYAVELGDYPGQRKDRRWGATLLSSTTF